MATSLTSQSIDPIASAAACVIAAWGSPGRRAIAAARAASSGLFHAAAAADGGPLSPASQPPVRFAIALAPRPGAALAVCTSSHALSPAARRSRRLRAAMSAGLWFPAPRPARCVR